MSEQDQSVVVASLEDETGDRCVDILRHEDGHFTYVECYRDPDDGDSWRYASDEQSTHFATQYAAYVAATRNVEWLME